MLSKQQRGKANWTTVLHGLQEKSVLRSLSRQYRQIGSADTDTSEIDGNHAEAKGNQLKSMRRNENPSKVCEIHGNQ